MVILDLSIVNVALPTIQTDLGFSSPDLQWVVNAYAITFAGFLMLGGRAADFFGQKKTFAASLLLFALASLAGGVAPDQGTLIAARGVQGFAGALMAATSLAIITSSFQGPALGRAVGLWASMNGLGGAAGMLFGGIITETLGWRWILLINLPIGIASAMAAWSFVVDRRRSDEARFDIAGAVTLTLGQMVLIYGVVQASTDGWSAPSALVPILGGIAILAGFAVIEARCGLQMGGAEVYLNIAGGYRLTDPAADLAVAAALISAFSERPVPADAIVFGELSLSGEVRQVAHDGLRLREAAKLGFSRGWGPKGMKGVGGISVTGFGRLGELVDLMLGRD